MTPEDAQTIAALSARVATLEQRVRNIEARQDLEAEARRKAAEKALKALEAAK
jgi:hypothetical protein